MFTCGCSADQGGTATAGRAATVRGAAAAPEVAGPAAGRTAGSPPTTAHGDPSPGSESQASCSATPYASARKTERQLSMAPVGQGAMQARQAAHFAGSTT